MSSQLSVAAPSLGMTLGVFYICATIAAMQVGFFGITTSQVAKYYKKYPDDWWIFQYSVGILWIFDALHVALSTHVTYHYLIDLFGDYDELQHIVWSFRLQILTAVIVIVGVQGIYTIRIWKLGRYFHRILPWIVVLTFIVTLGNVIFSVRDAYSISNFQMLPSVKGAACIIHSILLVSDFIITLSMCYYLHKSRKASGFFKTSDKLLGMMRLGVISGLATSTCTLLALITYLMRPNTFIAFGIDLILPKLHINSLLAMLNSRKARAKGASSESKALALTYHNSGTEVAHISIPMESNVSLEASK
ncbi:uncharacterized protein EV420DRAFT_1649661 [Desarmillaria tabescens]|uniref:DUF6534 domain-containing protein n=1 Tax=Armillaria tabescens TaxID=1929756 RepID=A0AA39JGR4_ARMTA|nr:uncharacterized protein EV420DRAFT_1649661 [Desarmillaria tabescens]KAK0442495.1 hypothetical protein EV420DRAFT_1649661 [Desarmillaria tabescens]